MYINIFYKTSDVIYSSLSPKLLAQWLATNSLRKYLFTRQKKKMFTRLLTDYPQEYLFDPKAHSQLKMFQWKSN